MPRLILFDLHFYFDMFQIISVEFRQLIILLNILHYTCYRLAIYYLL